MDGADLAVLVKTGELLSALKLFLTFGHCLWIYDYLLTLGDEIEYAWSGRKSWIFVLFIANRYTPVFYLIWVNISMFDYTKSFCHATKWIPIFHLVAATVFAQIAVALRIYAVTTRNKLIGGSLSVLISAQLCFGTYFVIKSALVALEPFPEINLDVFKLCSYRRWQHGEVVFTNLAIAFDLLSFLIILVTAKRLGINRHPGVPSILDAILRDATLYFIFIFVCQVMFEFFLLFAPEEIQILPGLVYTVFVPMMASRLMLSLKKAAVEPAAPWSLETMSNNCSGMAPETIHFASLPFNRPLEVLEVPSLRNEGDIESESVPRNRR